MSTATQEIPAITGYTRGPLTDGRADWRARDVRDMAGWSYTFSAQEGDTLSAALTRALAAGIDIDALTPNDFPLPGFAPLIDRMLAEIEHGRGLFLLRGFPVDRHTKAELRYMYVGLTRQLGTLMSQSSGGDHIGDVRNFNVDVNSSAGRAYTSKQKLTFHSDQCDIVSLMVLRVAKEGGLSKLASALAIRNEIARTRPDLLDVLHQPFPWSWQEQQPPGDRPWYLQPVYTEQDGRFSSYYIRTHINSSQRYDDAPRLAPRQIEAMDLVDQLANDDEFNFATMFQPGDVQFLNNHVILHSRTAFEDFDEDDRRRHLLRIWLSVPGSRPLHAAMHTLFQDQRAGAVRGGFPSRTGRRVYETTVSAS
jgi:hypothetical protein